MANCCELTGKRPTTGNLVSHSNIKTRTRWLPNTQKKQYVVPELGETLTLRLSTRAIRTIDKQGGLVPALRKAKEALLSPRLQRVQRALFKKDRQQHRRPSSALPVPEKSLS